MFTGLVKELANVKSIEETETGIRLCIDSSLKTDLGDSICVNGACLTVVSNKDGVCFDVINESLSRTGLGKLKTGDSVNLEPSLKMSDLLGGHLVSGHVDFVSKFLGNDGEKYSFELKPDYGKYFVEKGSVCINGVSLTLSKVTNDKFSVCLIPETLERTNLGTLNIGNSVNIEIDLIARYLEKLQS